MRGQKDIIVEVMDNVVEVIDIIANISIGMSKGDFIYWKKENIPVSVKIKDKQKRRAHV